MTNLTLLVCFTLSPNKKETILHLSPPIKATLNIGAWWQQQDWAGRWGLPCNILQGIIAPAAEGYPASAMYCLTFRHYPFSFDRPLWPTRGCSRTHEAFVFEETSENVFHGFCSLQKTHESNSRDFQRLQRLHNFQRVWRPRENTPHSCVASENDVRMG